LSAYLDRELTAELSSAVRAHLEGCPGCRELLGQLRATSALLGGLAVRAAPGGLAGDVQRAIERRVIAPVAGPSGGEPLQERTLAVSRAAPWPRVLAVAASVVLAAGIGIMAYLGREPVHEAVMPPMAAMSLERALKTAGDGTADGYAFKDGLFRVRTEPTWGEAGGLADADAEALTLNGGAGTVHLMRRPHGRWGGEGDLSAYRAGVYPDSGVEGQWLFVTEAGSRRASGAEAVLTGSTPGGAGRDVAGAVNFDGTLGSALVYAPVVSKGGGAEGVGKAGTTLGIGAGGLVAKAPGQSGPEGASGPVAVQRAMNEVANGVENVERLRQVATLSNLRVAGNTIVLETDSRATANRDLKRLFWRNNWESVEEANRKAQDQVRQLKTAPTALPDDTEAGKGGGERRPPEGFYFLARQNGEDTWVVITDRDNLSRFGGQLAQNAALRVDWASNAELGAIATLQKQLHELGYQVSCGELAETVGGQLKERLGAGEVFGVAPGDKETPEAVQAEVEQVVEQVADARDRIDAPAPGPEVDGLAMGPAGARPSPVARPAPASHTRDDRVEAPAGAAARGRGAETAEALGREKAPETAAEPAPPPKAGDLAEGRRAREEDGDEGGAWQRAPEEAGRQRDWSEDTFGEAEAAEKPKAAEEGRSRYAFSPAEVPAEPAEEVSESDEAAGAAEGEEGLVQAEIKADAAVREGVAQAEEPKAAGAEVRRGYGLNTGGAGTASQVVVPMEQQYWRGSEITRVSPLPQNQVLLVIRIRPSGVGAAGEEVDGATQRRPSPSEEAEEAEGGF